MLINKRKYFKCIEAEDLIIFFYLKNAKYRQITQSKYGSPIDFRKNLIKVFTFYSLCQQFRFNKFVEFYDLVKCLVFCDINLHKKNIIAYNLVILLIKFGIEKYIIQSKMLFYIVLILFIYKVNSQSTSTSCMIVNSTILDLPKVSKKTVFLLFYFYT